MNLSTSTSKRVFFTYTVIASKMITDEESGEIVGIVALEGARVKRRVHGVTEELLMCANESERVAALEKWFGIVLSEKEQKGILRTVTALPVDGKSSTPSM